MYTRNFILALITQCRAINNRGFLSLLFPPLFLPLFLPRVEGKKATLRYFEAYASLVSFAIEYRLDFVLNLRVTGHLMKTEPRARHGPFNSSHLPASRLPRGGEGRARNFTSITFPKL